MVRRVMFKAGKTSGSLFTTCAIGAIIKFNRLRRRSCFQRVAAIHAIVVVCNPIHLCKTPFIEHRIYEAMCKLE